MLLNYISLYNETFLENDRTAFKILCRPSCRAKSSNMKHKELNSLFAKEHVNGSTNILKHKDAKSVKVFVS